MRAVSSATFGIALAVVAGVTWSTTVTLRAAEPLANIGTLICVTDPAKKEPLSVEQDFTCSFEPLTGPKVQFVGIVKRIGSQTPPQARLVLAWTVIAPEAATPSDQLQGRYVSGAERGGQTREALIGGTNGSIALQPLAMPADLGDNAAPTVVELQIAAVKA